MAKRQYKLIAPTTTTVEDISTPLPIHDPVAVYYRQSTEGQIGNISTSIQTIDMVAYLAERGWDEDNIYLIDMDAGVSGTKRIDERPGMRQLFDLITERQIRAVACQDEDRLFRDVTQIQVNIFIEACRNANVLVITPSMVYDFANSLTGAFHARQFRFKCEMAAEYINTVILGKLTRARQRMAGQGQWAGSRVALGYMVDKRKTLPNGAENPNWRKYTPFPPYAAVVHEYFRLFLSYNGNLLKTARHIQSSGPFNPDPSTAPTPEGFQINYGMAIHGNGLCPSLSGLGDVLTNAVYIGHWSVNGTIKIYNNHEPIVPLGTFMQAFNYLSEFTLEGHPNLDFHAERLNGRPSRDEQRPVDRPLYAGLMVSLEEGTWHNVGSEYLKAVTAYRYVFHGAKALKTILWAKIAPPIDAAITELLHAKLRTTFNSKTWDEVLEQSMHAYQGEHYRIEKQLATLRQVMEKQIVSLETLTNQDLIRAVQERYEMAQAEFDRLTQALQAAEDEGQRLELLSGLKRDFSLVLEQWDQYTSEQKRRIVHLLIKRLEALPTADHSLELTVHWLDGTQELILVRRKAGRGTVWSHQEVQTLLDLFDNGAGQLEIAQALPDRVWKEIQKRLKLLRGKDSRDFEPRPILHTESYSMYLTRTGQGDSPYRAISGTVWISQDQELLLELLDQGATRVELATQFPYRTWRSIRQQVVKLRGTKVRIRWRNTIRQNETIEMYWQRTGAVEDTASLPYEVGAESGSEGRSWPSRRADPRARVNSTLTGTRLPRPTPRPSYRPTR